jgi:hypothetical protein
VARKSKKTAEQHADDSSSGMDFISKILNPIKILIEVHLKLALRELKKDSQRFFSGFLSFALGCFFIVTFYFLLNVLFIVLLNELLDIKFLKLFYCILIDTGLNLFIAIILFLAGKASFKKPFFSDTRKIFEDTMKEMKK